MSNNYKYYDIQKLDIPNEIIQQLKILKIYKAEDITEKTVKAKWKNEILQCHQDKTVSKESSEREVFNKRFLQVQNAYQEINNYFKSIKHYLVNNRNNLNINYFEVEDNNDIETDNNNMQDDEVATIVQDFVSVIQKNNKEIFDNLVYSPERSTPTNYTSSTCESDKSSSVESDNENPSLWQVEKEPPIIQNINNIINDDNKFSTYDLLRKKALENTQLYINDFNNYNKLKFVFYKRKKN